MLRNVQKARDFALSNYIQNRSALEPIQNRSALEPLNASTYAIQWDSGTRKPPWCIVGVAEELLDLECFKYPFLMQIAV